MSCGPGDLRMLVHIILNVANNKMGRPPGWHLKDILKGFGWVDFTASWGDLMVWLL